MQRLSLVDESFDLNFINEYILSIQVSLDGFSFSILDAVSNKIICLYHQDTFTTEPGFHLKKISTIYNEVDLLTFPYKETRIFFSAPDKTTLVPIAVFSPELAEDFYRLTLAPARNSKILCSFLPGMGSWAVFEVDRTVHSLLEERHAGAFMQSDLVLSGLGCPEEKTAIRVKVLRKNLVIQTLHDQTNFYNSFYYEGENDMLYYILGTAQNMNLKPDLIILDGMVNRHESIYHRLRQYFEHVEIAKANPHVRYSDLLRQLPDARFTNLFNSFSYKF
ncbi:MAG: DUF3822 family protein [Prolixibacteraceae bacterium]